MRVGDEVRFSHVEFADSGLGTSARTVVAIPSGPGFSHRTLNPWLGGLPASFRVATIDFPGSGHGSLADGLDYSFASYVEDLDAVRRALGQARVCVLGHGWGAAMAVEYTLARPDAVEALILINPLSIFTGEGQDGEAQARMIARVRPTLIAEWTQDVAPTFQAALTGEAHWDAVETNPWWGRMIETQFAAPPPRAWHEAMQGESWRLRAYATYKGAAMSDSASAMAHYDLAERAGSLRRDLPVLILSSHHDANYVAPAARHAVPLAQAVPQAELVQWEGVGHFPFVERQGEFADAVEGFLRDCVKPGGVMSNA